MENSEYDIKEGEKLFRKECGFVAGSDVPSRIPFPDLPEIAFAGRSNVGKSSLINALTFRKSLARASNTPGRTQQINFFNLGGRVNLVDLPGYGYALASKNKKHDWNRMVLDYLLTRQTLKRVILLIDSRRGLLEIDRHSMDIFDEAGVPYTIVLTKSDKIKKTEQEEVQAAVMEELIKHPAAMPYPFLTSAEKHYGMDLLRGFLATMLL